MFLFTKSEIFPNTVSVWAQVTWDMCSSLIVLSSLKCFVSSPVSARNGSKVPSFVGSSYSTWTPSTTKRGKNLQRGVSSALTTKHEACFQTKKPIESDKHAALHHLFLLLSPAVCPALVYKALNLWCCWTRGTLTWSSSMIQFLCTSASHRLSSLSSAAMRPSVALVTLPITLGSEQIQVTKNKYIFKAVWKYILVTGFFSTHAGENMDWETVSV